MMHDDDIALHKATTVAAAQQLCEKIIISTRNLFADENKSYLFAIAGITQRLVRSCIVC